MTTPRRRIVRPPSFNNSSQHQPQIQRFRGRLERERAVLARWLSRFRRAFYAMEKSHRRIRRWENQLVCLEISS